MTCPHDRLKENCSACNPEQVYRRVQASAKRRNLPFSLTYDEYKRIISQPCFYCGSLGVRGLDRRRNDFGYVLSNVVSSCWPCNLMKGSKFSEFDFLAQARKITQHQEQKLRKAAEEKLKAPTAMGTSASELQRYAMEQQ